jgi:hypothetical protein
LKGYRDKKSWKTEIREPKAEEKRKGMEEGS